MYALIENNSFVKWVVLSIDYPNTSFPVPLTEADLPEGVVKVEVTAPTEAPNTLEVLERLPEPWFEDGAWKVGYAIRPMNDDEVALTVSSLATQAKEKRNKLLAESDWTQLADVVVDKAAWTAYRQALRDIPTQQQFPVSIVWPTKPQ